MPFPKYEKRKITDAFEGSQWLPHKIKETALVPLPPESPSHGVYSTCATLGTTEEGVLALSSVLSVHFEQKTQILGDGSEISNEVKIAAMLHQISSYFFNQHLLYEYIIVKISEI